MSKRIEAHVLKTLNIYTTSFVRCRIICTFVYLILIELINGYKTDNMGKIKARESQNVEYKSTWHDKYLEWICGFANAQGAVMYFGVNDNHKVIGLENVDKLMEDIPNKIVTTMGILADVNLHEQDGKESLVSLKIC